MVSDYKNQTMDEDVTLDNLEEPINNVRKTNEPNGTKSW